MSEKEKKDPGPPPSPRAASDGSFSRGIMFIPLMNGMVQPLFYPIRQAALESLCELDEIVETVEDSSHHFARLTKDGSLVGVCTELEKPLSSKSASRILNRGRGRGKSVSTRGPYSLYEFSPRVPLAECPMASINNPSYIIRVLKISMRQFHEIVVAAEQLDLLKRTPAVSLLPPKRGRSKYTSEERVFIGLHHFQAFTFQYLSATYGVSESCVSRYFDFTLGGAVSLKSKYVVWPSHDERKHMNRILCEQIKSRRLRKFGTWGFIDGTLTRIQQPSQPCESDSLHTNFLTIHHLKGSGFFLGSMAVVSPDGQIRYMATGFTGSTHDMTQVKALSIFASGTRNSQGDLYFEENESILGDKGFFTAHDYAEDQSDLESLRKLSESPHMNIIGMFKGFKNLKCAAKLELDESLLACARQSVEQTFGQCGGLFPILRRMKTTGHIVDSTAEIIGAVCTLYQMWFPHRGDLAHVKNRNL